MKEDEKRDPEMAKGQNAVQIDVAAFVSAQKVETKNRAAGS